MSKTQNTPEPAGAKEAPAVGDFPLSLDEYCQRLSSVDKRVELIGAFHYAEKAAGHGQDTTGNFDARFKAFVNQPA